jgi:hydrogenase maturation protein HypF
MIAARRFVVRGTVQGVGFRPFVARLAEAHRLNGWVLNAHHGVEIQIEGGADALAAFTRALTNEGPPASRIEQVESADVAPSQCASFRILHSQRVEAPVVRISPDLAACGDCLRELRDPGARRFEYPYITCAHCGPRYTIVRQLPYDRSGTTMAEWPLCAVCAAEYRDPRDRRFHAESIACPDCGPHYRLISGDTRTVIDGPPITGAAELLKQGSLLAIKGVGGYHLCCDAANQVAVAELRRRKVRKVRPFALMVRDLTVARALVEVAPEDVAILTSAARPIVLAPARVALAGVAPDHDELGVMLPYAPVHHLLFAAGAPDVLVMTSGNLSNEPIAFEDDDALQRLSGIADAFLIGGRAIARRVDDSVIRSTPGGPVMLRRGRGYAPAIVARLPASPPILALGADLKNAITLVIDGAAVTSQHVGDLQYLAAAEAFRTTIEDLIAMHEVNPADLVIAHDAHPHYASTAHALQLPAAARLPVQHHRAHIASVLAEHGDFETPVVGVAFDGTGYGDDGTIWGGEFFVGSLSAGLQRVASLQPFSLPGGDAAARHPMSAAAGALSSVADLPDLTKPPFAFPARYTHARELVRAGVRTFTTTSAGRLFDTAAALVGFAGENEYEGQAPIWLEHLATAARPCASLPYSLNGPHLDFGDTFRSMIDARLRGQDNRNIARAFHETIAAGVAAMVAGLCEEYGADTVVLSGGVFQNRLLVERVRSALRPGLRLWINQHVPPNDGGISLGQAAIAAVR